MTVNPVKNACVNLVNRMWVGILAMTIVLVPLSKTLNTVHNCFSSPRNINGYQEGQRMIKLLKHYGSSELYTPQGAEKV